MAPAQLSADQNRQLVRFLEKHPDLRLATPAQCQCDDDIRTMRTQGSFGTPLPDYDPHLAVGDFNGDGRSDFAILLDDRSRGLTFVIFNGGRDGPAYVSHDDFDMANIGVFPPGRDTGLLVGPFESEGCLYELKDDGYREDCSEDD
ncbi:MAG: hypothetical protein JSR60_10755 [Proteobacteria bacterium]|nr:hypothetical protein [Pseudomonadota bacterium]